jgi:hypothetical protein
MSRTSRLRLRRAALGAAQAYYAARRRYFEIRLTQPGAEDEVQELFGTALAFELTLRELGERRRGMHDGEWALRSMAGVRALTQCLHVEYTAAAAQPASRGRKIQNVLPPRVP